MEHRLHRRESMEHSMVRLVHQGRIIATVPVVDISAGGLSVKSPRKLLNRAQCVDVEFAGSNYVCVKERYISAMVIHSGPDATGLMFARERPMRKQAAANIDEEQDMELKYG